MSLVIALTYCYILNLTALFHHYFANEIVAAVNSLGQGRRNKATSSAALFFI
nr:MAG TPA: hypothetical protein [Caudoviricetes sp.]